MSDIKKELKTVIASMHDSFQDGLFSKTNEELEVYWLFEWDEEETVEQNL